MHFDHRNGSHFRIKIYFPMDVRDGKGLLLSYLNENSLIFESIRNFFLLYLLIIINSLTLQSIGHKSVQNFE
jgi:hypothetical protein